MAQEIEADNEGLEFFIGIGGQKRFKCPAERCGYDHYSEAQVFKHWKDSHQEEVNQNLGVTLFDAEENIIEPEEPIIVVPAAFRKHVQHK